MGRLKEIRRKRALKLVFMALAFPLFLSCGAVPPEDPFYLAEAKSSLARGHHWYQVGCYREAERFFSESLTNARLSDSVLHIVMSLNAKGASRLAAGDKSGAAAVLNEALELTTSEPGRPELPALLGNLGTLAYQAGRPEDARDFWSEASREAETRGESPAPYLASLARLSFERGDGEAFKAALSSALSGLEDPSCPKSARADVLNLAALSALEENDPTRAEELLEQALALDRELESQAGLAQDLELRFRILSAKGDHAGAAQSLGRAFYLRASLRDAESVRRDLSLLRESRKNHGLPENLAPFEAVAKNPELFDPLKEYCP